MTCRIHVANCRGEMFEGVFYSIASFKVSVMRRAGGNSEALPWEPVPEAVEAVPVCWTKVRENPVICKVIPTILPTMLDCSRETDKNLARRKLRNHMLFQHFPKTESQHILPHAPSIDAPPIVNRPSTAWAGTMFTIHANLPPPHQLQYIDLTYFNVIGKSRDVVGVMTSHNSRASPTTSSAPTWAMPASTLRALYLGFGGFVAFTDGKTADPCSTHCDHCSKLSKLMFYDVLLCMTWCKMHHLVRSKRTSKC